MIIVKEKKMKKALVCIRSKKVRMNTRDVPWITQHLKDLIRKREQAFHKKGAELIQYKLYRNQVNRERKLCKAKKKSQSLVKRDETIKRRICELYK